jgi:hypothetical protein
MEECGHLLVQSVREEGVRQTLTLMGQLPRMNAMAGNQRKWAYHNMKKKAEQMIGTEILVQKLKPMAFAYFSFIWFEPNKKFNPDNIMSSQKFILDALVTAKILKNDGWSEVLGLAHQFVCVYGGAAGVQITMDDKAI